MKNKKPTAILCADLHIRDDQPICRTDNYFEAQDRKLNFLISTAANYSCPIICAGDFFHKAKSNKSLEIYVINLLKNYPNVFIYCIPGNHDLPYHNIKELDNSSLGILNTIYNFNVPNCPIETVHINEIISNTRFLIMHKYTEVNDVILYMNYYINMLKTRNAKFLLLGDNHYTFNVNSENRFILNPGSMMRMTADQINHKPCFFFYYEEDNSIEQVFFPIENNVIIRDHLEIAEEENKKMMAYITRMNKKFDMSICFEENFKNYFLHNEIKESIKKIIWRCLDE